MSKYRKYARTVRKDGRNNAPALGNLRASGEAANLPQKGCYRAPKKGNKTHYAKTQQIEKIRKIISYINNLKKTIYIYMYISE